MKEGQERSFRLFDLPSELRYNTYTFVLEDTTIDIWRKQPLPPVLKVNKQLYNEAVKVLYQTAAFNFRTTTNLCDWYSRLPRGLQTAITCLRYVSVSFNSQFTAGAARHLNML